MKRITAVLMCLVLLFAGLIIPVNAEDREWTEDELSEGFRFDCLYVTVRDEYTFKFDEFTPEMFSAELVESVEEIYPYDEDNEYTDFRHFLKLTVKEPSFDNICMLYMLLYDNEYVSDVEFAYLSHYVPVYPESAAAVPSYTGSYAPFLECCDDSEKTVRKNMLYNPYYQLFYNQLLGYCVYLYSSLSDSAEDFDYISYYVENYIDETPCYVTLIFASSESELSVKEYNNSILGRYFGEEDILYVGDYVNAAVVCVDSSDIAALTDMQELEFIGDAFFSDIGGSMLSCAGTYYLGDVYGDNDSESGSSIVSAADARYILRYCAGLERPTNLKRFYFCADMNLDNKITSADARLALRTSAGLEKSYKLTFSYSGEWKDCMVDIVFENM